MIVDAIIQYYKSKPIKNSFLGYIIIGKRGNGLKHPFIYEEKLVELCAILP